MEYKRIEEALRDSEVKTSAFMNTVEERVNIPIIEYSPFADTQKQRISTIQEADYE